MDRDSLAAFRRNLAWAFRKWVRSVRTRNADNRAAEDNDPWLVAAAASLLQVSEFEFFRLAYSGWYGREIPAEKTEQVFARYMLHREVPFWVRHLARRVNRLYAGNALDPRDFGVERPPPPRENPSLKLICGLLLGAIYALFFLTVAGYLFAR